MGLCVRAGPPSLVLPICNGPCDFDTSSSTPTCLLSWRCSHLKQSSGPAWLRRRPVTRTDRQDRLNFALAASCLSSRPRGRAGTRVAARGRHPAGRRHKRATRRRGAEPRRELTFCGELGLVKCPCSLPPGRSWVRGGMRRSPATRATSDGAVSGQWWPTASPLDVSKVQSHNRQAEPREALPQMHGHTFRMSPSLPLKRALKASWGTQVCPAIPFREGGGEEHGCCKQPCGRIFTTLPPVRVWRARRRWA